MYSPWQVLCNYWVYFIKRLTFVLMMTQLRVWWLINVLSPLCALKQGAPGQGPSERSWNVDADFDQSVNFHEPTYQTLTYSELQSLDLQIQQHIFYVWHACDVFQLQEMWVVAVHQTLPGPHLWQLSGHGRHVHLQRSGLLNLDSWKQILEKSPEWGCDVQNGPSETCISIPYWEGFCLNLSGNWLFPSWEKGVSTAACKLKRCFAAKWYKVCLEHQLLQSSLQLAGSPYVMRSCGLGLLSSHMFRCTPSR